MDGVELLASKQFLEFLMIIYFYLPVLRPKTFLSVLTVTFLYISDIEVANRHGHTCLMIACYKGHLKIAKYLIDAKADVNRKSVKGKIIAITTTLATASSRAGL